jgi:hypothetical protein
MKECESIVLELPGYVSGGLDGATLSWVRSHLESCLACQSEVSGLERLEKLLLAALPSVTLSPTLASTFANRLAAEIAEEEARQQSSGIQGLLDWLLRPWLIPVAAAAVLGAVMFAPLFRGAAPTEFSVPKLPGLAGGIAEKKPAADTKVAESAPPAARVVASGKPPEEVISRPDLFVDFAVIRDLDVLEAGEGKAG